MDHDFIGLNKKKSEELSPSQIVNKNDDNVFHRQTKKLPIALTFFRFSHRDKDEKPLTNQQQAAIVDNIYQNIYCMTASMHEHEYSSTLVPFYDSLIDSDMTTINYSKASLKK